MAKTGRKSSYETVILPNIERIKELLAEGYSEKDVAGKIGISYTTWKKYKSKIADFTAVVLTAREKNIKELENSMYIQALGFTKKVQKAMKLKTIIYDESGKKKKEEEKIEYYEEEIYIPPSQSAGAFLLKNWAKDSYSNNPAELEQKKQEFEHKKTTEDW